MDDRRFDDLTRVVGAAHSRRGALRLAAVAGLLGLAGSGAAEAKETRCPRARRCGRDCCKRGQRCRDGKCRTFCSADRLPCKGGCVDPGRDDFGGGLCRWTTSVDGSGPAVGVVADALQMTLPDDATGATFAATATGKCKLRGDFDLEVGFDLLRWPTANGVRAALAVDAGSVQRSSRQPGDDGDHYVVPFGNGGFTETQDLRGRLRLARSGSTLRAYRTDGAGEWEQLGEGQVTTADQSYRLQAWSHDTLFGAAEVRVAFDTFRITKGQLVCPRSSP